MSTGSINIDKAFKNVVGEFGHRQKLYCLFLSLTNCYYAFQMLQYKFVALPPPSFTCYLSNGTAVSHIQCGQECAKVSYPEGLASLSVTTEWDLVCSRAWLGPLTMSVFMTGVMLGAVALGPLSDRFGRKPTMLVTFSAMLAANAWSGTAPDFPTYCAARFFTGFFESGSLLAGFVLMNELIGASKRGLVSVASQAFFAVGVALFSLLAYGISNDWRTLTQAITALGLPFVFVIAIFLPESPRWLQSRGHNERVIAVLKHIALKNKAQWKDIDSLPKSQESKKKSSMKKVDAGPKDSLRDLLKHEDVLYLTLIQIYSWFANSAAYYGLTLAAGGDSSSGGDVYLSTALSGLVEVPAYALTLIMLPRMGRRFTVATFMIVGGAACASIALANNFKGLVEYGAVGGLALLGKLCISASFAVIYVHSNEIFPTSIRSGAMGLVSFAARVGGILSPYLAKLGSFGVPNLHFILFGTISLTSGYLNSRLPETAGRPLPETIEDLAKMKDSRYIVSMSNPSNKYSKLATEDEDHV